MKWALGAALAIPVVALIGLWVRNYRRTGDAPRAARQSSQRVLGVAVGAILSVLVIAGEFLDALAALVSFAPETFGQVFLGFLAIAGFAGWIELGVVTATIAVVLVLVAVGVLRR